MIERGVMFAADGMYEMQCEPDTFEIGDLVEVVRATDAAEDRIRKTSDKEKAIGAVPIRYAEPTSRVRFVVPPERMTEWSWDDHTQREVEEREQPPDDVQHLQDCLYAIRLALESEQDDGHRFRHIERILSTVPKTAEQKNADSIISLMGIDPNAALKVKAAAAIVGGTACAERKAQDLALLMGEIHKPEYFIDATNNDLRTITPAFAEVMTTLEGAETEEDASGLLDRCRQALALLRKMTGGAS